MELALRRVLARSRSKRRRLPPSRWIYHMLWAALSLAWVARSVIGLLDAHGALDHIIWGFDVLLWPMLYRWHYHLGTSLTVPPHQLEWTILTTMIAGSIAAWTIGLTF